MGMEVGSWADWVSGIGSISAAVIALWLSGAERRARRESERPTVNCEIHGETAGWVSVFIGFDNPSSKKWRCVSATVVRPAGGLVVRNSDTMKEVTIIDREFDVDTRAANAKSTIDLPVMIGAVGSSSGGYGGGGRGNYSWERLQVDCRSARNFSLRLELESFEPVPDKFAVTIKRPVPPPEL